MDLALLLATLGIVLMSLVIIGSATHINTPSDDRYWFVARQGIFALVNVGFAAFLLNFDYIVHLIIIYVKKKMIKMNAIKYKQIDCKFVIACFIFRCSC